MIVVVGSRDVPLTEELAIRLAAILSTTEAIAIRKSRSGDLSSPLEQLASLIGEKAGLRVVSYCATTAERRSVYLRDYAMVRSSDRVFAVFSPERVMTGGTAHVVKAALDEEIPVEAYTFDEDGTLLFLGSDEGNPYRVHSESRADILEALWEGVNG